MELQSMIQVADGIGELLTTPGEPGTQVCQAGEYDGNEDGGGHQETVVVSHRGQRHAVTQEDGN